MRETEHIACPYCLSRKHEMWAEENGYTAVKCLDCALVFVNPRPSPELITEAVKTGVHRELDTNRTAIARRVGGNVGLYKSIVARMFTDLFAKQQPFSWLDVGAGYGELVEAVSLLAPTGSTVVGLEPMSPKVKVAQARGLNVQERYLKEVDDKYDVVSLMNVFSHIPDFREFLDQIKNVLQPHGEFFLETGNIADLAHCKEAPSELDLPDHLVFAGEKHIRGYLTEAGFEILGIQTYKQDGFINLLKNIVKKLLGRKVQIAVPYTSSYRTMLIRARRI